MEELAPWFHDLDLYGVRTAPDHPLGDFLKDLWSSVAPLFPSDMSGTTVLDIGCNGGFYALRLAERGAEVTAIDHDPHYLAQARYAVELLDRQDRIRLLQMDAYDVGELGRTFDYVVFMGVLYHLRHPLLALERIRDVVGERMVFQSMVRGRPDVLDTAPDYPIEEKDVFEEPGYPVLHFVEHRYGGDPTNWWIPNDAGAAALLRAAGFEIEQHVGPGVYACRPEVRP